MTKRTKGVDEDGGKRGAEGDQKRVFCLSIETKDLKTTLTVIV